ncbi:response regulator [Methanobacterium paludis]|uniref:Response regulator receiver n=1 Tax=Methanobacterium paludis (strain DSM 25820 / JCM 18151 / SWAN1) TaxID=868131 RepID=F6D617_METPW|nr:response regulator [Methanobacterium paludis]AEG17665.1 response regulator receiver [Methanobacterium paludis]
MDILIAEGEYKTVSDLKTILERLGIKVVAVVSSGEEAIQKAGDLSLDLILININLKGKMNGVEAANKIADLYKIPIIFLAVFIKNCLIKSLQLPEDAIVLSKPLRQEKLEYCISRVFSDN